MILRAPTGSYRTVLPKGPEDPTSVVYSISAQDPPRSSQFFIGIPDGIRRRIRDERNFTTEQRRKRMGDLIFTTKSASPFRTLEGARLYSYGQVTSFETGPATVSIAPTNKIEKIETKHNNNYIDPVLVDLDSSEQLKVETDAIAAQRKILDDIERLQKSRAETESAITNYQKVLAEIVKVLKGLNAIIAADPESDVTAVRSKLLTKQKDTQDKLAAAVDRYNSIGPQITRKRDGLLALSELVK